MDRCGDVLVPRRMGNAMTIRADTDGLSGAPQLVAPPPTQTSAAQDCKELLFDFSRFSAALDDENAPQLTAEFHARLNEIDRKAHACGPMRAELMDLCIALTAAELDQSLIHRQGRHKPMGYAGDFQIIDWTYTHFAESATTRGIFWDKFYHQQVAPMAVRERKARFGRTLKRAAQPARDHRLRILNVGSGPCREIVDGTAFAGLEPSDLDVLCVDMDDKSVAYARHLLGPVWDPSLRFHIGNAVKFRPQAKYDFIWSAGLFDYLSDRIAASLLRRMWHALDDGGILEIGNFAPSHATRPWIEWCGRWFLIHRDTSQLLQLAALAGVPRDHAVVELDQWSAIGFLRLHK